MDAKQHENLGIVLRYGMMSKEGQERFIQEQRDRIAKKLREARIRVKANKAANGGIYAA
jgi:hypothetical protein